MHLWRLRQAANLVNLSTPVGVAVALAGRATLRRGPRGLVLASGYGLRLPVATAFTLGNVVVTGRPEGWLEDHPRLLAHEERHATQYAACLGLPLLPLYAAAAAWSAMRTGHPAVRNAFERRAGLADGGYPLVNPRRPRAARAGQGLPLTARHGGLRRQAAGRR